MRKLLPILSIIDNSQNLSVLELGFFSLRSRDVDIAQSLASAIRKKGRRLQRLYITSKRPIEFHNMHRILWSSAAVQYLRLEFYYYRDWDLNVVAMYDQQLQEMAMEALCGDKYIGMEPSRIHSRTLGSELNFEWRELHLRYENFGEDFELLLKALRHSPMLESLTIPSPLGSHLPQEAFSVITTVSFPRLQHLDLYYIDTFNFDAYNNLQPLFEACIDLKSIVLGRKFRNSKVIIDSLILHSGHSLDRVILIGSPGLRSEDIIHILSACPRLRIFDALKPLRYTRIKSEWPTSRYNIILRDPYIQVKDIQSPKLRGMEWACSNLETLRITYRNEGDTADIQESLCQQISRLTKLQDLRLSCYDSTISGGPHGSCIGANGPECVMDALKDWNVLKDLRTLELRGLKDLVDRKELSLSDEDAALEKIIYDQVTMMMEKNVMIHPEITSNRGFKGSDSGATSKAAVMAPIIPVHPEEDAIDEQDSVANLVEEQAEPHGEYRQGNGNMGMEIVRDMMRVAATEKGNQNVDDVINSIPPLTAAEKGKQSTADAYNEGTEVKRQYIEAIERRTLMQERSIEETNGEEDGQQYDPSEHETLESVILDEMTSDMVLPNASVKSLD
ncbi:hypothetical protein BGZ46_005332 [Entomortierella lignicola]|nr:hypothetical protein BGZ46_005332 [Entomortierella lignicola]